MLTTEESYLFQFDATRARLRGPDLFKRFRVPDEGEPLAGAGLDPETMLLVVERGEARRAFPVTQMAYHHAAQGELDGAPYVVSFCAVCHSGVGMVPLVDGELHHFSAGGLYNGLVLFMDDETRTYWDHIRGLALHGTLRGTQLETFPLRVTTVGVALQQDPELTLSRSTLGRTARAFGWMFRHAFQSRGRLPPGFRQTMGEKDGRLPEMTHGLGVVAGKVRRFYPLKRIGEGVVDEIEGRPLRVVIDPESRVPLATWGDGGALPMQIFSRWYGFALTYPGAEIFPGPS